MTKMRAIQSLKPGAEFVIRGETVEWLDKIQTQPTDAEIDAEIARLQAQATAAAYKAKRAKEYPAIGDQLDALFHAGVFPTEMAALIQAVKDKYPKEQA
jgi:hypothetical protein